jgi:diadenosine tetraphosphate (Ap4A) HIT family hydrolase
MRWRILIMPFAWPCACRRHVQSADNAAMPAPPVFKPAHDAIAGCDLCVAPGGVLVWSQADWRVIRVDDAAHPAFYRVVCNRHVREFSDLAPAERRRCMDLVCAIERVLIDKLTPTKINIAALGNMVPHLHWHVIARFEWDSHFPNPVWGDKLRDPLPSPMQRLAMTTEQLDTAVIAALSTC